MKQSRNKFLADVIDKEEEFKFRPYIYTPRGTSPLSPFAERNQKYALSRKDTLYLALAMAVVVAPNFAAIQDGIQRGHGSL